MARPRIDKENEAMALLIKGLTYEETAKQIEVSRAYVAIVAKANRKKLRAAGRKGMGLSKAEKETIKGNLISGEYAADIAEDYSVSYGTVLDIAKKNKIEINRKPILSEEEKERRRHSILEMRVSGATYEMIAEELELSASYVPELCRRFGVKYSEDEMAKVLKDKSANPKEEVAKRIAESGRGITYVKGYQGRFEPVVVRCSVCKKEFEMVYHTITSNPVPKETTCPHCREARQKLLEEKKINRKNRRIVDSFKKNLEERLKLLKPLICEECGRPYINPHTDGHYSSDRFCSRKCSKRYTGREARHIRRARIRGNNAESGINLTEIFSRDKGVCWLCGGLCDYKDFEINDDGYFVVGPNYPSIDHVTPIAKGGSHTWNNVKLAHHKCNWLKGDNIVKKGGDNGKQKTIC